MGIQKYLLFSEWETGWIIKLALVVREMEKCMGKNEIVGYEPLVDDLKDLIHKKQYQVLKSINSETVNL